MRENEAAKLLQQFSGTLRFGKRRLHLRASLTEKASETQDIFESAPPTPERRSPPPESVSACMIRMLHHMGNIFRDNVGASGYRGLQLDRKRRKELQEWKIALGHRENDHEDPANYPTQSY